MRLAKKSTERKKKSELMSDGHARSLERQARRQHDLQRRIKSNANDHFPGCVNVDPRTGQSCGRPTARASKTGLSASTCRRCQQFKARHGSLWCKGPPADLLRPYVTAAVKFVEAQRTNLYVSAALAGLGALMASAGPAEIATRLRGLPPEQRARIALARLREADIKPDRLLAIAVAVHALIEDAPGVTHRVREWRIVAIAKAAHRLASGTHKVWPVCQPDGRMQHIEMHA